MIWKEILNNGILIYEFDSKWVLKDFQCNIKYYEEFDIEPIDEVICAILDLNGGQIEKNELAGLLGFNVVDDFDVKRYADQAEIELFNTILKPVYDWELVVDSFKEDKKTRFISLTPFGKRAIELKTKYHFFTATKNIFEHFKINAQKVADNLLFPFHSALDILSDFKNVKSIKSVYIFDSEVINKELLERLRFQSCQKQLGNKFIYEADQTSKIELSKYDIKIRLYKYDNEIIPLFFTFSGFCIELTELVNHSVNDQYKEQKIHEGLFKKILNDETAILDYESIIQFEDLLNLYLLVADKRILWTDPRLFNYITENASGNSWVKISENCNVNILKENLIRIFEKADWSILTHRIENDFIKQTIIQYPWDFSVISKEKEVDFIEQLLLNKDLADKEWDWDELEDRLDFDFIKENLKDIDFHLFEITKNNIEEAQTLIPNYLEKKWDWKYISTEYDLSFILINFNTIAKFIDLKIIIDRVFTNEFWKNKFIQSSDFESILKEEKEKQLKSYSVTTQSYVWNIDIIDYLDNLGFISWSNQFSQGFECNSNIHWTTKIFDKYKEHVQTGRGFSNVSRQIDSVEIINNNSDFNWDWSIISHEERFVNDINFIISHKEQINWLEALNIINVSILENNFDKLFDILNADNNQYLWTIITKKCTVEFVRRHLEYNWDWKILTKLYCSTIKISSLGNNYWVDKWDWDYLTQYFEKTIIVENLVEYAKYWDWTYLLDKVFLKEDLELNTSLLIISECISVLDEPKQRNCWHTITQRFTFFELRDLIKQTINKEQFKWDFTYFCTHKYFNIGKELDTWREYIDWYALSASPILNNFLRLDKTIYSNKKQWVDYVTRNYLDKQKYAWDFHQLSKLQAINGNFSILYRYIDLWDWDYLTEHSGVFAITEEKDLISRISKMRNYVNFNLLSKRSDTAISLDVILYFPEAEWNWQYISENTQIKLSKDALISLKDKDWNWSLLTNREDVNLSNELIIQLIDKAWDWSVLSSSDKLSFDTEFIEKILQKPINWMAVSKSTTFLPSKESLVMLSNKELDWNAISSNEGLDVSNETLNHFKNRLNWSFVSKNKYIDYSDQHFLLSFKDYLDWDYISKNEKFILSFEWLNSFKDFINWTLIIDRKDFQISDKILSSFQQMLDWNAISKREDFRLKDSYLYDYTKYLDWDFVSKSTEINLNERIIDDFQKYWNWQILTKNPIFIEKLDSVLNKYSKPKNIVSFLDKMDMQNSEWKGYIYHFTHLFNAIEIIKSRKISSRNLAKGFADAAAGIVHRRDEAHQYARFYFRPQTPTQFYNECLGMDSKSGYLHEWRYWDGDWINCSKWKSYYPQAKNFQLPKCPMPVFFKFDIKEVIQKMPELCHYSNGNMQTNRAKIFKLTDDVVSLNFEDLYSTISVGVDKFKEYSQQEFLILHELDFSDLNSFEIVCYDDEQERLLKDLVGFEDPLCRKVSSNGYDIFHRNNRKLWIETTDNVVSINSEYQDQAYFSLTCDDISKIKILDGNILKEEKNKIIAYPNLKFEKSDSSVEVSFVDESNRNWIIYKN